MSEPTSSQLGRELQKIVHDYRQILCVVLAASELATLRDACDARVLAEELESIKSAARRGIALTQELQTLGEDLVRNGTGPCVRRET